MSDGTAEGRTPPLILSHLHDAPPAAGSGVRYAGYQGDVPVGELDHNTRVAIDMAAYASRHYGAHVIAFPELFLSGYALNPTLVRELAEPVDGPHLTRIAEAAAEHGIAIVCPYPERATQYGTTHYYDAIAVFGPDGGLRVNYRKTHLYGKAERENFSAGNGPFPQVRLNDFPIGLLNCYEAEFAELPRIQAVKGAKFVIIPTAADHYYELPDGKRTPIPYPDVSTNLIPAQAYMNELFIAYCNYTGYEQVGRKSWHLRGNSVLADPHGKLPLQAPHDRECLLVADVVPDDYGPTHPEGDYLKDRRPGLYQELIAAAPGFDDGYTYGS